MEDTPMRAAMEAQNLSYRDLGFLTDLDPGYLCRIANGERRPSRIAALKISKVLPITPASLMQGQVA